MQPNDLHRFCCERTIKLHILPTRASGFSVRKNGRLPCVVHTRIYRFTSAGIKDVGSEFCVARYTSPQTCKNKNLQAINTCTSFEKHSKWENLCVFYFIFESDECRLYCSLLPKAIYILIMLIFPNTSNAAKKKTVFFFSYKNCRRLQIV